MAAFQRDDLHRETARMLANGLVQTKNYNDVGLLSSQLIQPEQETLGRVQHQAERQYYYDQNYLLTQVDDSRLGKLNYQYDAVGRLIQSQSVHKTESFTFDPAGNLIDPIATQASQVKSNLIAQYQGKNYKYDAQGNVIESSHAGKTLKLTWDNLNRLIQSELNGQATEYGYDVFGRRLYKKNQNAQTLTLFGWDGDLMIWESQQSNDVEENYTKHYVYEPQSFVPLLQTGYTGFIKLLETPDYAQFQHEDYSVYKDPLWKTETRKNKAELERVLFYHCDQVGTPQTLTNELGECIWEIKQNVWGDALEIKASHNLLEQTNIRFQGQYYDSETGLHYNRYRYYEPHSARYVSKDPIGLAGGLNNLAYVSDPNQWVDALGLAKVFIHPDGTYSDRYVPGSKGLNSEAQEYIAKLNQRSSTQATSKNKSSSYKSSDYSNKASQDYRNAIQQNKAAFETLDRGSKQLEKISKGTNKINSNQQPDFKGYNFLEKTQKWVGEKRDQIQKGHENFGKYSPTGIARDRELDHIDRVAKCILENKCTLDYAVCSGGMGPLSTGAVVNLHDGSVYLTGSVSGTSIPNEVTKMLNTKNLSPFQLAKGISQSVAAKGGSCSFGTITNKSQADRADIAEFVNRWLPGKSVTTSVGFFGVVGGVTVPHTQKWFDPNAQIGIEVGGGSPRIDMSEGVTSSQRIYQIEFLNKANRK